MNNLSTGVLSRFAGAFRLLPGGLRVVLYHHLSDNPTVLVDKIRVSTPASLFEAHLRQLQRDYEIVDLDAVLAGRLPKRALLITFDDGYRSVLDVGGPILEKLGLPSVFFVSAVFLTPDSLPLDNLLCLLDRKVGPERLEEAVTGRAATGRSLGELIQLIAEFPYSRTVRLGDELGERFAVDAAQVRADSRLFLDRSELSMLSGFACEVGNHTRSHVFCRAIVDDAAAETELVEHRKNLEDWAGSPVRSFSYPHGYREDATPYVEQILASSGHEASFLVESRWNGRRTLPSAWNRVSLHDRPVAALGMELEVLPRIRALRDRLPPIGRAG